MGAPLDRLTIKGFKSIRLLQDFRLKTLNILIGANGAGKSNFVDFFRLLENMVIRNLSRYTLLHGMESMFFNGPKETPEIYAQFDFKINKYRFTLQPSATESVFVSREESALYNEWRAYSDARSEARLADWSGYGGISGMTGTTNVCGHIYDAISSWRVYHFHDTSYMAPLRRSGQAQDINGLRNDGSNIGPLLYHLKENNRLIYQRIVDTVRLIAPYFDDFSLQKRTMKDETEVVRLEWRQVGSNFPFTAAHLSDGTLRFIALATALLQPYPPSTIIIDEPELGLHPYALDVLAGLFSEASERMQVIVATQSPAFVSNAEPEEILIVGRKDGGTVFNWLDKDQLSDWLTEYSLGELWQKNVIDAGPDHV